jgi:hypothetical protein
MLDLSEGNDGKGFGSWNEKMNGIERDWIWGTG